MIHFNQRGAGCGKTYESIQLLNGNNEKFKNKTTFIYLTKLHTVKEVIKGELKKQRLEKKLSNLIIEETIDENKDNYGICGKQFKFEYFNNITDKDIKIIMGTIDSFTYAISNKKVDGYDYFKSILYNIQSNNLDIDNNDKIKYAKEKQIINEECLIIIDEAQDLNIDYLEAFKKIIEITNIDVYIIGDKLQSISIINNTFIYLQECELLSSIKRIILPGFKKYIFKLF